MPEELKTKIKEKINLEKPHSYWRFFFIDFLRIFSILALLLFAGYALAYFIWDALEAKTLIGRDNENVIDTLSNGLPELLLIVLFISTLMYLIYRQTDLPLVKNRIVVYGSVWIFLIILTSSLVFSVYNSKELENNFFTTQNQLENLPYRPKRFDGLYKRGKLPNIFVGKIVSIRSTDNKEFKVTIKNRFEEIEVVLDTWPSTDIELNSDVEVVLDPNNSANVLVIKKLPPQPFRRLTKDL